MHTKIYGKTYVMVEVYIVLEGGQKKRKISVNALSLDNLCLAEQSWRESTAKEIITNGPGSVVHAVL